MNKSIIVKSKPTLFEDDLNDDGSGLDCAPIEEERVDPLEEEKNNNVLVIKRTYSKLPKGDKSLRVEGDLMKQSPSALKGW